MTYLLSPVNDILRIRQSTTTGATDYRVVPRGSVGHFHGTEL